MDSKISSGQTTSTFMILLGLLLLLGAGAFALNGWLVQVQADYRPYLMSAGQISLLPPEELVSFQPTLAHPTATTLVQSPILPTESLTVPIPTPTPTNLPQIVDPTRFAELVPTSDWQPEITPIPALSTAVPSPTPTQPALPIQTTSSGPIVRLTIPSLDIERGVISINPTGGENGDMGWDTGSLFANKKRKDLIGMLAVSSNPGEGGNMILVGHNFNEGFQLWNGVFFRLSEAKTGEEIIVEAENGDQFRYIIQEVNRLPWKKMNKSELERHRQYLWPTPGEQLTLVTCGGSYSSSWTHRIYVVAIPEK